VKHALPALALLASACAATTPDEMALHAPKKDYHSAKARAVIADCLMNRLSAPDRQPEQHVSAGHTVVAFTYPGPRHDTFYHFLIRDEASGSAVEARMPKGLTRVALPTAETCF
jgi:hypothetical protein